MRHKLILTLTTALVAGGIPTLADAQTQSAQAAPDPAAEDAAGNADAIVVTARRRSEALTSVPVAVTVLSGDSLANKGITRVDDLTRATPSLTTRPTAGRRSNSQYEIRGISTVESLVTGDPAVGIYVNEVYRSRATGTNQSLYDIANIQVLYGPQGTLFGRNSSSGAVLITTNRPTDVFEGEFSAGYGNYNAYELTGMLNIPVSDSLSIRLAGQRSKRDGFGRNMSTGRRIADQNSWSGRVSVLWKPTDTIENLTIGNVYHANERGSLIVLNGFRPCPSSTARSPGASCSTGRAQLGSASPTIREALEDFVYNVAPTLGTYQTALDPSFRDFRGDESVDSVGGTSIDPLERPRNYGISNMTTIALSDTITLKNIIGYNYTKLIAANDLDGTPLKLVDTYYRTTNKTFTEELQIQGDMGAFQWVVGGLYFQERGRDIQNSIQLVTTDTRQNLVGINKSYAAFAQGTYEVLPGLSLTAGARYTRDTREARYINPRTINLLTGSNVCSLSPAIDTDGDCVVVQKTSFNQPTYTLSVDYKPSRDTLFYVAHRYGYRSGGLQARVALTAFGAVPPFEPETVKDLEVGFKGSFDLGGGASIYTNVAAYKAWYKDLQRQVTLLTGLTSPLTTTAMQNAGKASVKGFEAEVGVTLTRGFQIAAFWGHVDGVYKNFPAIVDGEETTFRVPFATSKNSAGVTVTLTPVDDDRTGRISWVTTYSYRSPFYGDQSLPILEPESRAPAQNNVNTSLSWDDIGGSSFSAQAWVRNALNNKQILGFTALASSFGVSPGTLGEPRTYGLTLKYRFGN